MDPSQPPRDPEPGLVEVRHRHRDQRRPDGIQAAAQRAGDPLDHAGDRARGDRDAEQLAHRLAGAMPGQELPMPQVRARRRDPRPVLHWRGHPRRRGPGGHGAARAAAHHQPVLGDQGADVAGQIYHLAARGPGHRGAGQASAAARAPARLVPDDLIRMTGHLQRGPRLALRRPGFRPPFFRSDRGAGLTSPSDDGGLEEFREFWPTGARRSATSAVSAATCARSASSCP
jgi:hypothetical protein